MKITWICTAFFCFAVLIQLSSYSNETIEVEILKKNVQNEVILIQDGIPSKDETDKEVIQNKTENDKKTILFWNSYWDWRHFQMGVGNRGFKKCPNFGNCYTTTLRSKLFNPSEKIDAIVFHGVGLKIEEIQALKAERAKIPKLNHGVEPVFVLFMLESPMGANLTSSVFDDFFNLTFTYRSSADVSRPYGAIVENRRQQLKPVNFDDDVINSRPKDIAWVVSHCETENHREDFVEAMKKANSSLKIDIFGKCAAQPAPELPDGAEAYQEIAKTHKFYLSFENSNCFEYVTEKFFNALKYGLIPIVYGGLTSQDYAEIAPPNSFIYAEDFSSPELLMKELERISSDSEILNSYLAWHSSYEVKTTELEHPTQCQFCDILNDHTFKSTNDYGNFKEYWHKCRT